MRRKRLMEAKSFMRPPATRNGRTVTHYKAIAIETSRHSNSPAIRELECSRWFRQLPWHSATTEPASYFSASNPNKEDLYWDGGRGGKALSMSLGGGGSGGGGVPLLVLGRGNC